MAGRVVLVTGASRLLGARLATILAADPRFATVIGVDAVPPSLPLPGVDFIRADIRNPLIAAVMDASLGPVRSFASPHADGPSRVRDVFEKTFPLFQAFEAQMRAAVQLSLEQWAQERAGTLEEEPYKRGHRVRILGSAIAPLSEVLEPATQMRLHQALTVVYGIETYMVLKDIWGLSDRAVEKVALWMADALVTAALNEAQASRTESGNITTPRPAPKARSAP